MDFYTIFWFLLAAISAALPIPFIKEYTMNDSINWIIYSITSYLILILSYSKILRNKNITIIYPLLKVLSVLIVITTGLVVFGNKMNIVSGIGIIFGIISLYLLSSQL